MPQGEHEKHHYKEALELDRVSAEDGRELYSENSSPLDSWRQEKAWTAKDNLEEDTQNRAEHPKVHLGGHREKDTWQTEVEELSRCPWPQQAYSMYRAVSKYLRVDK